MSPAPVANNPDLAAFSRRSLNFGSRAFHFFSSPGTLPLSSRADSGRQRLNRRTTPMIKPKLHHVTIKTSRLDEMIAWYALVVGAEQGAAWMTNDAANHRIAFLAVPGLIDDAQKANHNGMHHCAFEYDS